jgi:hypothetical protein
MGPLYKSSQIQQNDWDFSNVFKAFNTASDIVTPKPTPTLIIPGNFFNFFLKKKF